LLLAEVSGAPKIAKTEDSAPALLDSTVIAQNAVPTQQNNTGVGETKPELDPRLITKPGEVWKYTKPPTCAYCADASLSFYADGTFSRIDHETPPDTTKGAWYTENKALCMYDKTDNDIACYICYISADTIDCDGIGPYYKTKR
jgi:hypothetical protein